MNTENITRVRWLDLNTVLYSGSAYQSQGSSAAGHWIIVLIDHEKYTGMFIRTPASLLKSLIVVAGVTFHH